MFILSCLVGIVVFLFSFVGMSIVYGVLIRRDHQIRKRQMAQAQAAARGFQNLSVAGGYDNNAELTKLFQPK